MSVQILEIFIDFAKNTSLHGIKYIVLPTVNLLERMFWIVVLMLSLAFAGYLTTLFWARYTSNPTRTTLGTAFAPITAVPFPAVTICNRDKILKDKVNTFLGKIEASKQELLALRNVFSHLIDEEFVERTDLFYNLTELVAAQNALDENDYSDMRRIIRRVSQRCEDLIIKCAWNNQQVSCKDIFEESYTAGGRCCSFNYVREKSLKSERYTLYYGLSNGLRMLLTPKTNGKDLAGVTVIIHSPEDVPGALQNVRNYVSIGRVSYMHVYGSKRECSQEVKLLPIGHRQCLFPEEQELKYFKKYTDSNCMSICEAMSVYKLCGCVPYYFQFIDDKPICDFQKLPCLENLTNEGYGGRGLYYSGQNGELKFTKVHYLEFFCSEGINNTENSILLNVFFSTNRQTIWVRSTMTSGLYLISSFGGIYSLFLGCSIITLIEILYYCLGRFLIRSVCQKNNKIKAQRQEMEPRKVCFKEGVYTVSKEVRKAQEYNSNPIMPFVN